MKLTITTFTTLDGVMQAPGGPSEDTALGFTHGGWLPPYFDAATGQAIDEIFVRADAFLLGRTTYDMMQTYWSQVTDPGNAVAIALNHLPKYVATHRPETLTWSKTRPLTGDFIAAIADLKQTAGRELQVHGSHGLVQQLLAAGLVDELNVFLFPVVVGGGKRLFGEGTPLMGYQRKGGSITSTGAVISTFVPTGAPGLQTFVVDAGHESVR